VNFRWRDLRHTFISWLVGKDVNLRTVQKLASHKTIQTIMRDGHVVPEHNRAAIEELNPAS
jgi:integrase